MTPTPWARAILAGCDAVKATYGEPITTAEAEAFARAALPHLLRAVVDGMDEYDAIGLRVGDEAFFGRDAEWRSRLLAALTDAAGRVGG